MRVLSYSLLQHLKQVAENAPDGEGVDVSIDCLSQAFGVSLDSEKDQEQLALPVSLEEIFKAGADKLGLDLNEGVSDNVDPVVAKIEQSERFKSYLSKVEAKGFFKGVEKGSDGYKERYSKLLAKYREKFGDKVEEEQAAPTSGPASAEADALKTEGNSLIQKGDYEQAVEKYTKAIELSPAGPNSHIYYCNRAAAYLHLKKPELASEDSSIAIGLSPDYAKAHSRFATAELELGNKEEAKKSAQRALELDPNNAAAQSTLKSLGAVTSAGAGAPGAPFGGAGMADIAARFQSDPELREQAERVRSQMGAGGGMPDMGSMAAMMQDPSIAEAAQKMMQDPQMMAMAQQMMQDPNAMANMMNMFGGGGPKP